MGSWRRIRNVARRVAELEKALVYVGDAPYYVNERDLGIRNRAALGPRRSRAARKLSRRVARTYFAWKELNIIPVPAASFGDPDSRWTMVGHQGANYPLREDGVPFDVYEMAVVLIRDGIIPVDAFHAAEHLCG